ncbi:MAG: c-type cytochrome [Planctomycetota bacterium]
MPRKPWRSMGWVAALLVLPIRPSFAQQGDNPDHVMDDPPADLEIPPAPVVPPDQAVATFEIAEGFELQLVASEPLVHDPVCMAWDGDGRLWVCEMRGYMPDVDGNGEDEPSGFIVILDDTDGDGVMDTRTVFLDRIVLPRTIAFAPGGILYADQQQLYFVRINPDGTAGARTVIDRNYAAGGNVEHKANGMMYGLDNWYYNAKSSTRYQLRGGRWLRQRTEERGQWGITQDDVGRILANDNSNFIHGELLPPHATMRNPNFDFGGRPMYRTGRATHPIRVTPGVNRGYLPGTVSHETWKLISVTGACGPVIYRGDQYPDAYYGNVFIPEPCGNLLKRVVLTEDDGRITATHAYPDTEFLASRDERSRFVNAYNGPDGCLYLVDMYRGIIQHRTYVTSYLRRQILSRGLDTPVGLGRIYRVVYTGNEVSSERPAMSEQSSIELVAHLSRKNAWWRETAQRLLVERRDPDAVPALRALASDVTQPLGQTHALWTLQGMNALDIAVLEAAAESYNQNVQVQVIRLAEEFAEIEDGHYAGRALAILSRYAEEGSWQLDLQIALSAGVLAGLDTPEGYDLLMAMLERHGEDDLFRRAIVSGLRGKEAVMLERVTAAGGGPITNELTAALVKATENGDLSIGSLIAMVDSEMFEGKPEQRLGLLEMLGAKVVENRREDVAQLLIERMAAPATPLEQTHAILRGMQQARADRQNPIPLDGEPELFRQWREAPPQGVEAFLPMLEAGEVFSFEKVLVTRELAAILDHGREQYSVLCSVCHRADGEGEENIAPPLVGSQWVTGNARRLSALVLNGVTGPIEVGNKVYSNTPGPGEVQVDIEMANFKDHPEATDYDLAAVMTYIRHPSAWGNNAPPVTEEMVRRVRNETSTRNRAYTAAELRLITPFEDEVVVQAPRGPRPGIVSPAWLEHRGVGMAILLGGVTLLLFALAVPTWLLNRKAGPSPSILPRDH